MRRVVDTWCELQAECANLDAAIVANPCKEVGYGG